MAAVNRQEVFRMICAFGKAAGAALVAIVLASVILPIAMTSGAQGRPIARADLCVTLGAIAALRGGRLSVTVPKMRAVVPSSSSSAADLRFTYVGPSKRSARLGSGELRRQFGLK